MYLEESEKEVIVNFLREKLSPAFIYLYGSYARGEGRGDSDVDIGVHPDFTLHRNNAPEMEKYSQYYLMLVSSELSSLLGKEVQIVNLAEIPTVFAAQIVGGRLELYGSDSPLKYEYNIRTFKEYALLNEERKEILDRIREEGRVYGRG